LHGSFSANFNRSDFTSDFFDGRYTGTVDTFSSSVNFHPEAQLTLAPISTTRTICWGRCTKTSISAGGILQQSTPGQSSNSWDAKWVGELQPDKTLDLLWDV